MIVVIVPAKKKPPLGAAGWGLGPMGYALALPVTLRPVVALLMT